MTLARSAVHEIFLAHAGADRSAAEMLFDLLAPDVRPWLDTRCLLPDDEWPKEIARAQRAAVATVVLLSRNAERAYPLTDEIHTAIALHRRFPDEHRAVAVFLDGMPADLMEVPAGLRSLHSLDALAKGGLEGVARKLKGLVAILRERGAPLSRPAVRALVEQLVRSDSDLTAFCIDYFPQVHARFTNGMNRVDKINELLAHADLARIVDKLREAYPDAGPAHAGVSGREQDKAAPPSPIYRDDTTRLLSTQIQAKQASKLALKQIGADTSAIDNEIVQLRRQLREGGQLTAGDALSDGRYLLIQRLGRGGFANVWEAYDSHRLERVAIKVLHSELAGDVIRRERFFRGARIMGDLYDEAIVRVLEPHAEEAGYHYFVMELLAGGDLRRAVLSGCLVGQVILPAIVPVAEALAKAHAKGLVHRDVKPANLLLDTSGKLRLTDFDLVSGGDTTGGTRTGAMGTFIYAAPELMHRPQDADARADVYGLGMTIAFGLHGAELTMDVLRDAARLIQELPCSGPVKALLTRAVEWKPGKRFANAGDFCDALRKALAQAAVSKPQEPPRIDSPDASVSRVAHALARSPGVEQVTEQAAEGSTWREPVTGMSFVWVPPGRFLIGSSTNPGTSGFDPEAYEDETPAHEVKLSHGVWMGEHPVTNAQYRAYLAGTKHVEPEYWRNRRFNATKQPVVGVNGKDALAFCAWLTECVGLREGSCFDLPTEAEWEHAARGSDGRKYPWGNDDPTPEQACFGQPWATGRPAPVGGRPAGKSPFGCQDMAGNVWEWCLDVWQEGYGHVMTKSVDPCHHGDHGAPRVVRGGSWLNLPWGLRCAVRDGTHPWHRRDFLGFRVVCRGSRQPWPW